MHAKELKIRYFKRDHEKGSLIFLYLVSFCGQDYEKQKRPETSYQYFFDLQNMKNSFFGLTL